MNGARAEVLLADGAPVLFHRKLYLPTYGLFQEERFVRSGRRLDLATLVRATAVGRIERVRLFPVDLPADDHAVA